MSGVVFVTSNEDVFTNAMNATYLKPFLDTYELEYLEKLSSINKLQR